MFVWFTRIYRTFRSFEARRIDQIPAFLRCAVEPLESRRLLFAPSLEAPSDFEAITVSTTEIDLMWSDFNNDETHYVVQRSTDGTNFSTIDTVPQATAYSYTDDDLTPGTPYAFRVYAVSLTEESEVSSVVAAVTVPLPPAAPSGVSATRTSSTAVDVSWSHTSANTDFFTILRSSNGGDFAQIGFVDAGTNVFTDDSAPTDIAYVYQIAANNSGDDTLNTGGDAAISASGPASATDGPATPTLSAAVIDADTIRLTYSISDGSHLQLEMLGPGDDNFHLTHDPLDSSAGAHTIDVDGLLVGEDYGFRVRADRFGLAVYTEVSLSLNVPPTPTLNAPSGLTATIVQNTIDQIKLDWTDNSSNEHGFEVDFRSPDSWPSSYEWGPYTGTPANVGTFTSGGGIGQAATFLFRVRAIDSTGQGYSDWSSVAMITTSGSRPSGVSNLTITAFDPVARILDLEWQSTHDGGFLVFGRAEAGPWEWVIDPVFGNNTASIEGESQLLGPGSTTVSS